MTTTPSLSQASDLPYGVPDFKRASGEQLRRDAEAAFAEHLTAIEAIAQSTEPATFDNTCAAFDAAREPVARILGVSWTLIPCRGEQEYQDLEAWLGTAVAGHQARIAAIPGLAERVKHVVESQDDSTPTDERRLAAEIHRSLRDAGAGLEPQAAARIAQIHHELAEIAAEFTSKLGKATAAAAVHVTDAADLEGMRDADIAAARRAAEQAGKDGMLLQLVLPTGQPELTALRRRQTRQRLFRASVTRGALGDENDTSELVLRLVRLRAELASLLGFSTFAEYRIDGAMAPSTQAVTDLLSRIVTGSAAAVREREAVLREAARLSDQVEDFGPADWDYYDERVGSTAASDVEISEYLELNTVLTGGLFRAANMLYGLGFEELPDVVGHAPGAKAYVVRDADGSDIGVVVCDWYARDGKRGGAWMNSPVPQSKRWGTSPVVTLNLNVKEPAAGAPTLLSVDEAVTAFHEFGHVLHGLLSDVRFAMQAGTSVPRDFVEYPSQVNEMWLVHPDVMPHCVKHYTTGESLPQDAAEALRGQCSATTAKSTAEISMAAWLDFAWHSVTLSEAMAITDVAEFEREVFARVDAPTDVVPPRYASTYFQHIFSGYGAAYYSYLWSEVLDADTSEWFKQSIDLRESGDAFRQHILAPGDSVDLMESYADMMGREPDDAAFFARHGLG